MTISVSPLSPDDREQWEVLYRGYADFYSMPMTDEILDTVWGWIFDDNSGFFGLIAKDDQGGAVGLMHCRDMPSPLRGAVVGFLDDLFVIPEARGTGVAQTLYGELMEFGKGRNWAFVRWITAENNYRGRGSYDKVAEKTHWVTYQMAVG